MVRYCSIRPLPNSLPNIRVQEPRFGERQFLAPSSSTASPELGLNRQRLIGGGEGVGLVRSREVPRPLTRRRNSASLIQLSLAVCLLITQRSQSKLVFLP